MGFKMSEIKLKKENETTSDKVNGFLEKNRVVLFSILGVVVAAIVILAVVLSVSSKSAEKTIAAVDEITYTLTKDSASLEEADLTARLESAMEAVTPYLNKGGVGGVRANMLAGELAFVKKDYEKAYDYWTAALSKGKKSYTAPICAYNTAVCAEELGKLDVACENYKKAADNKDFIMKAHAKFSLGRVYEALNDSEKALETYKGLIDETPNDSWAKLAKSRVLALELNK